MKLIVKKGKDLSKNYIQEWNQDRIREFDEDTPLKSENRKKFAEDIFFTLYDSKNKILSSGRLKQIRIKFIEKKYEILGGADLVSNVKGKGYGKKIKKAQIKYAKSKNKTLVGFCTRKNTPFYKKCGLKITKDSVKRFFYNYPKGKTPKEEEEQYKNRDVTSIEGKDKFLTKFLKNPKEKVIISIPHW
jgi:predicted GNAT family acetyltransferase